MKEVSVLIPVYNEADAIEENLTAIMRVLIGIGDVAFTVLLVDDGSTDGTSEWLSGYAAENENVDLLRLTRNFGKEAAIFAGLQHSGGDAVVILDSDLQHPPQLIPQMLTLWRDGIDIVDACKSSRGNESWSHGFFAVAFYRIFGWLARIDIANYSDFKLLDRKVVDAYCALPERKRFFRGLTAWMGYPSAQVYFDVAERQRGTSSWSTLKLLRLSVDALTGFSTGLLHVISGLGVLSLLLSLVIGGIALYDKFSGTAVSGFTTVILIVLLMGSFIMVGLGIVGLYLEQIFVEIKNRPVYLVDRAKSRLRHSAG